MPKRLIGGLAAAASAAVILAVGLAPLGAGAADHLDAPTVSANGATDLTDVYAYSTNDATKSVLIANVNPGAGALPNSTTSFGTGVQYNITVDTNGDASPDITYLLRFAAGNPQGVTIWRNGKLWGAGTTGKPIVLKGGTKLWAGLRDDPFFFDLDAFKGNILGAANGRKLCDAMKVDFFKGLNVSAIVLLVPNCGTRRGREDGRHLGQYRRSRRADSGSRSTRWAGRASTPSSTTTSSPVTRRSTPSRSCSTGRSRVEQSGPRLQGQRHRDPQGREHGVRPSVHRRGGLGLADVLVPDLLTYKVGDKTGFLNGRRLTDDVIDTLLAVGANTPGASDCIGNDSTFSGSFPFLGAPN